jgi:hypothetical protein
VPRQLCGGVSLRLLLEQPPKNGVWCEIVNSLPKRQHKKTQEESRRTTLSKWFLCQIFFLVRRWCGVGYMQRRMPAESYMTDLADGRNSNRFSSTTTTRLVFGVGLTDVCPSILATLNWI